MVVAFLEIRFKVGFSYLDFDFSKSTLVVEAKQKIEVKSFVLVAPNP